MSLRFKWAFSVSFLLLPFLLLAGCEDSITGLELPETDPETVLFLDEFDDENGGEGALNWTEFENFDVLEGCVDLHGNGFYDVQPGHGLYVDMDGTCEDAGAIETKEAFEFAPDEEYVLEFWIAGNNRWDNRDSMDVSVGSLYEERIIMGPDDDFELYERRFTPSQPTEARLKFEHYGGDDQGILIDLIRIRRAE